MLLYKDDAVHKYLKVTKALVNATFCLYSPGVSSWMVQEQYLEVHDNTVLSLCM